MDIIKILKITAKSAPIPTLAAVIAYIVLPKLIEKEISTISLIVISILTFLIVFSLLFYGIASSKSQKNANNTISNNEASELETKAGDIFIGDKKASTGNISKNKIKKAKTNNGDIFIGRK